MGMLFSGIRGTTKTSDLKSARKSLVSCPFEANHEISYNLHFSLMIKHCHGLYDVTTLNFLTKGRDQVWLKHHIQSLPVMYSMHKKRTVMSFRLVENRGFEPLASALRTQRAASCANSPDFLKSRIGGQYWTRTNDFFHVTEALYQLS